MRDARENTPPDQRRQPGSGSDGSIDRENDVSNRPLPTTDGDPDVGLSQKGTDEDAVIRRETEI